MTSTLGALTIEPARLRLDLLAPPVRAALADLGAEVAVGVAEIDPTGRHGRILCRLSGAARSVGELRGAGRQAGGRAPVRG